MMPPRDQPISPGRRRALAVFVNSSMAAVGAALAALLGVFAVGPARSAAGGRWIRAATVEDLTPGVPVPRVVAAPRVDGWYRARVRTTVFLVWDGAREVQALSATCTHLGCQVHWDGAAGRFECPCHGGVYGADGQVLKGPPPRPLAAIEARVQGPGRAVLVRL